MKKITVPLQGKPVIAGNTDTGLLKILALFFMIIDHVGVVFFPGNTIFRLLGRLAFPLYCWCLVVGATYSKNIFRYMFRLFLVGIFSQPIYMLALSHSWYELNVFFTLFLGLVCIWAIQVKKYGSQIWVPILALMDAATIKIDYGWKGILFIFLLYLTKKDKGGIVAFWIAYSLFWGSSSSSLFQQYNIAIPIFSDPPLNTVFSSFFRLQGMVILALPFVYYSTNSSFVLPKWLNYSLYPLHLLILWITTVIIG